MIVKEENKLGCADTIGELVDILEKINRDTPLAIGTEVIHKKVEAQEDEYLDFTEWIEFEESY